MNQIAKLQRGGRLLPIHETDALRANVGELARFCWRVDETIHYLNDASYRRTEPSYALTEAERHLDKLGEFPPHAVNTLAMLDQVMQEATVEQIADGLAVLHGLFGSKGEPEIVASTGVEIIEAEHASAIALHSALLVMLRPGPKERTHAWDEGQRPPLRKFMPTIPELLAELQDQQEYWGRRARLKEQLKGLPERLAQARQEITKVIAELRAMKDARRKSQTTEQAAG
jgi:hypothetical protein